MAVRKIRLSLICASRDESERLLANNDADLAICRARNRSVGNDMEWRALGAIEMDFYAASGLFADSASPLSLLDLSTVPQLVMHPPRTSRWRAACRFPGIPSLPMSRRCCAVCWSAAAAGDSYRRIFTPGSGNKRLHTEVGSRGLVRRWSPSGSRGATSAAQSLKRCRSCRTYGSTQRCEQPLHCWFWICWKKSLPLSSTR